MMTIDRQHVINDLNFKESISFSNRSTPLMFSRDSSMDTLSSFNVNFHSHNSTYTSEHSTNPSGLLSPSDIPDSPPRGCDDDIEMLQHERQRSSITALNNTNSTGRTLIPRPDHFDHDDDDDDVERDSIRNYATSPHQISYHDDGDIDDDDNDDNHSIHSSISSLSLPPPPSTSTAILLSNINELRKAKHNLSVINEESFHEHADRRTAMTSDEDQHRQEHPTQQEDNDDEEDDDQRGKQLLFDLIRQRLPYHQLSLATSTESSKIDDQLNKSKSSSSSSCLNDQTMRDDTSAHDITIPSSTMQESGYDSLLPMGSAPKRSLSNASLSTTRSIIVKKKHRCDEENDDPMQTQSQTEMTDDDDEHYDKKAGEALLRNLIAQVLPSFNPRYLNGGDPNDDDDGHDEMPHPIRRPSPMSQVHSSSTTSSVRSLDLDIEMTKKSEKNFSIRSTHHHINELIHQDKIHSKRLHIHKPVSQTKSSELRRLQNQTRR